MYFACIPTSIPIYIVYPHSLLVLLYFSHILVTNAGSRCVRIHISRRTTTYTQFMNGWPFIGYITDVLNTTIISIATMTMTMSIAIFVNTTITMLIVTDFSFHIHIMAARAHSFSDQFLLVFAYVIDLLDCKNLSPSLSWLSLCWFLILVFVNPITNTIHAFIV